jgi:hypothetical protein
VTIVVLLGAVVMFGGALWWVQRHRRSFVPQRGTSVGADLGAMADKPRVRVRTVDPVGSERVHLVLAPEDAASADMDLVVFLQEGEGGLDLLLEWERSQAPLAMVIPPGSRLVRLRSIDDLQPLTLRRDDQA